MVRLYRKHFNENWLCKVCERSRVTFQDRFTVNEIVSLLRPSHIIRLKTYAFFISPHLYLHKYVNCHVWCTANKKLLNGCAWLVRVSESLRGEPTAVKFRKNIPLALLSKCGKIQAEGRP